MDKILIDLPETIQTQRLILQIPKAGFGRKLHAAINDGYEDYIKWLHWSKAIPTAERLEQECREHHAKFILRELIRYLIIDKQSLEVLGATAFPIPQLIWQVPQFGISYFIRKSARAKGYATEAAHAMTLLAFRNLNAKKLEIHCEDDNTASKKIPSALGYKLEYNRRGGFPRADGMLANLQTYSIFSESDLIYDGKVEW